MPAAARSPAQVEAARRNGGKSRGPVTPEGKARSRLNALRHGLAAAEHMILEGEDPAAWAALLSDLVRQNDPGTELEARLVHRLAAALWRQDRADRLEQACFAAAPRPRHVTEGGLVHTSPEETFDLQRFAAITRYRAEASREASRLLRELRTLRQARAEPRTEPGAAASRRSPTGPEGPPSPDEPRATPAPPEPGNDNAARTEPEPGRPLNRAQRRRLAALARQRGATGGA